MIGWKSPPSLHSLWSRPMAVKISQALEPLKPMWVEDPVFMDHVASIGEVAAATRCPIAVGETRGGRADFSRLAGTERAGHGDHGPLVVRRHQRGAQGGHDGRDASRAGRIPRLHRAGGAHGLNAFGAQCAKTAGCRRLFGHSTLAGTTGFVTQLPPIDKGRISVPAGAGLGTSLQPDVVGRADVTVRASTAADV